MLLSCLGPALLGLALQSCSQRCAAPRAAVASQPAARLPSLRLQASTLSQPAATEEAAVLLSGLQGKALSLEQLDVPTKAQVRAVVPGHCYKRSTLRSLSHVAQSAVLTALCAALGWRIPLRLAWLPLWCLYAAVTGTVAMGLWVLAHECGHGAFSDTRWLQDAVGYALHTALLVPYFSWQRSHAVHHANTNHIFSGETHVPTVIDGVEGRETGGGQHEMALAAKMGRRLHGAYQLFGHLTIGWPTYLLFGLTGGARWKDDLGRGAPSNHFWPSRPFSTTLWPGRWAGKVLQSSAGVAAALGLLGLWACKTSAATVLALYGGPLLVVNAWLIIYTWLQHTEVDVPHLDAKTHTYMRGAFLTIDRPYPPLIDWLHHRIGTTHVAHHIDCTIPHYHAREATDAIAAAFPRQYLHEPTPVWAALWRVACNCIAVRRLGEQDGRYVFEPPAN